MAPNLQSFSGDQLKRGHLCLKRHACTEHLTGVGKALTDDII